jgi:3-hydroxy-3-methylglutaryl CoA synthase
LIQNKNMTRAAKMRCFENQITLATASLQLKAFCHPENDLRICAISATHLVANDTATVQPIEVGTASDYDHYGTFSVAVSKQIGNTETFTVLNPTDPLPAGTGLTIRRANTTAGANTAIVVIQVWYVPIDRSTTNRP